MELQSSLRVPWSWWSFAFATQRSSSPSSPGKPTWAHTNLHNFIKNEFWDYLLIMVEHSSEFVKVWYLVLTFTLKVGLRNVLGKNSAFSLRSRILRSFWSLIPSENVFSEKWLDTSLTRLPSQCTAAGCCQQESTHLNQLVVRYSWLKLTFCWPVLGCVKMLLLIDVDLCWGFRWLELTWDEMISCYPVLMCVNKYVNYCWHLLDALVIAFRWSPLLHVEDRTFWLAHDGAWWVWRWHCGGRWF